MYTHAPLLSMFISHCIRHPVMFNVRCLCNPMQICDLMVDTIKCSNKHATAMYKNLTMVWLHAQAKSGIDVEIIFPVNPKAITTAQQARSSGPAQLPTGLAVLPGPAGGEGCSLEGGCAACPYMRMNTLTALMSVCNQVGTPAEVLIAAYKPRVYAELVGGRSIASAGCKPILHMRHFQRQGCLSDELVADMRSRVR